jgi:hypothetical protein
MLGSRYAVIGSAVGVCESEGIGEPEAGTLEARLAAAPGPARLIPTRATRAFASTAGAAELPIRSGSARNPSYFPLMSHSIIEHDALVMLNAR